jgi:secreted trypsin-like serine protease
LATSTTNFFSTLRITSLRLTRARLLLLVGLGAIVIAVIRVGWASIHDAPAPGEPALAVIVASSATAGAPFAWQTCSGVLVSPVRVLTAAHCIRDVRGSLDVLVGISDLCATPGPGVERRHVVEVVGHDASNSLDVVALVLDRPVEAQPRVPSKVANLAPGQRITSWTWTLSARGVQGCVVRPIELLVAPPADCAASPAADFEVDPTTMVCARTAIEGQGACFGDSGAPVTNARGELVAVVSRGFNCGHTEILARADDEALGALLR